MADDQVNDDGEWNAFLQCFNIDVFNAEAPFTTADTQASIDQRSVPEVVQPTQDYGHNLQVEPAIKGPQTIPMEIMPDSDDWPSQAQEVHSQPGVLQEPEAEFFPPLSALEQVDLGRQGGNPNLFGFEFQREPRIPGSHLQTVRSIERPSVYSDYDPITFNNPVGLAPSQDQYPYCASSALGQVSNEALVPYGSSQSSFAHQPLLNASALPPDVTNSIVVTHPSSSLGYPPQGPLAGPTPYVDVQYLGLGNPALTNIGSSSPAFLSANNLNEQFGALTGHYSNFDLVNQASSVPQRPVPSKHTNLIQSPNPTSSFKPQVVPKPASNESSNSRFSNPTALLHDPQMTSPHGPIRPNTDKKLRSSKRKQSSIPFAEQQRSLWQQASKRAGVPEDSVAVMNLMCSGTPPPSKRARTENQRKEKRDVEKAGGSCLLCHYFKKKCSGQRPCQLCKRYWERRVDSSTSFRWTCDAKLKLVDVDLFARPAKTFGLSAVAMTDTFLNMVFPRLKLLLKHSAPALKLLDTLEPQRSRRLVYPRWLEHFIVSDSPLRSIYHLHTYVQSALRWKRAIVHFAPAFDSNLELFEWLHPTLSQVLFFHLEWSYLNGDSPFALKCAFMVFEDVKHLKELDTVKPSAVEHLINALESLLKFLSAQIFDLKSSIRKSTESREQLLLLAVIGDLTPEGSACLLSQYRGYSSRISPLFQSDILPYPQCMKRSPELDGTHYEADDSCECYCSWVIVCFPEGLLEFFSHTQESFSSCLHDHEHPLYSLSNSLELAYQTFHRNKNAAAVVDIKFRQAISCSLTFAFNFIATRYRDHQDPAPHNPHIHLSLILGGGIVILTFYLACVRRQASEVNVRRASDEVWATESLQKWFDEQNVATKDCTNLVGAYNVLSRCLCESVKPQAQQD